MKWMGVWLWRGVVFDVGDGCTTGSEGDVFYFFEEKGVDMYVLLFLYLLGI